VGAGLAHELRNPIVAIDTFAQLLPKRLDDPDFLRDCAEVIPSEAKRIQALAEQLLDLARPREYEFVSVDLHTILSETAFLLGAHAGAQNVELKMDLAAVNHTLTADAHALRQVFMNLIQNAVQSIAKTGQPGRIDIRTIDANNHAVVEIEDSGPGIPDKIKGRLFRPFASAERNAGLGLGLAICAEIARIHGGTISADNVPRGGAVFRVSLPTANHAAPGAEHAALDSNASDTQAGDHDVGTARPHPTAA
jgi:two-component system sensor histidine kinase HydH